MTLQDVSEYLFYGGGILFVLSIIIQIAPIKINPWSWLARCIGRAINKDVIEKVDEIDKKVIGLEQKTDERNATLCRTHILRFGDETLHGVPHSYEHYQQIMIDIDTYEKYCGDHPNYKNNVAVQTIKHIKHMYQQHLEENSFL